MADAPWPMAAGVLGMTRMTRQPPPAPSMDVSCPMEMPAATLTTSVVGLSAAATLATAVESTYGFTAKMSTSALRATSALSRVHCTPRSAIVRRGPDGDETHTCAASTEPAEMSPRTSADAMLPAPMTPRRSSRAMLENECASFWGV